MTLITLAGICPGGVYAEARRLAAGPGEPGPAADRYAAGTPPAGDVAPYQPFRQEFI